MLVPDGYSGTALPPKLHKRDSDQESFEPQEVNTQPPEKEDEECAEAGLFGKLSLGNLGSLLPKGFGIKKLGGEEILILAVAAFLIFSDGDIECAIMLILLLFIS